MAGRKPLEDEKMVSVSVCLTPREVRAIRRVADAKGVKLAHMLRVLVRRSIQHNKCAQAESSLTL